MWHVNENLPENEEHQSEERTVHQGAEKELLTK